MRLTKVGFNRYDKNFNTGKNFDSHLSLQIRLFMKGFHHLWLWKSELFVISIKYVGEELQVKRFTKSN